MRMKMVYHKVAVDSVVGVYVDVCVGGWQKDVCAL